MSKHTPGPWKSDDLSGVIYACNAPQPEGGDQPAVALFDDLGCHLYGPDSHDERMANARLMASAPRLFDALEHAEHVLRRVASESGLTHSDAESCADEAMAALSEAVGINLGES